ncbi:YdcF family protein [Rhodanobacter sp. C01]|uniref:YdcF family protein n=1 Tax=Rhodanobacter sp. C01 TaxID=1945856 RepID=UPI0009879E8A|nr:YdcF family protein [Rhodanobacter sp. C01]OOG46683.1 hypothetical protein B0E50_11780 [Rhodanobacter sp. C01]
MTSDALVLLLLVTAVAAWTGRRRLASGLAGLALLLFLAVGCGPLPRWLLHSLQAPYMGTVGGWAPRNAIVLLGAGTTRVAPGATLEPSLFAYGRIVQAARLYRDCKASGQQCMLLVSGGDSQHHGMAEAAVYAPVLLGLGVSAQDLQLESRSMNTWQNAQFSRPLLQAYDPQKLVLVSSAIHLRRSMLYFTHFGLRPVPAHGDTIAAMITAWPQSSNLALCDDALHEYLGVAQYHVYNALGWNAPPVLAPLIPAVR